MNPPDVKTNQILATALSESNLPVTSANQFYYQETPVETQCYYQMAPVTSNSEAYYQTYQPVAQVQPHVDQVIVLQFGSPLYKNFSTFQRNRSNRLVHRQQFLRLFQIRLI